MFGSSSVQEFQSSGCDTRRGSSFQAHGSRYFGAQKQLRKLRPAHRQSLRQKHLAHRDELQSHVTEEPAITPHVLKYALDLMKLKKENPSNWESLIGKQAAMFTFALPVDSGHVKQEEFAEQQEEQFPPEPSTPLYVKKSGLM